MIRNGTLKAGGISTYGNEKCPKDGNNLFQHLEGTHFLKKKRLPLAFGIIDLCGRSTEKNLNFYNISIVISFIKIFMFLQLT